MDVLSILIYDKEGNQLNMSGNAPEEIEVPEEYWLIKQAPCIYKDINGNSEEVGSVKVIVSLENILIKLKRQRQFMVFGVLATILALNATIVAFVSHAVLKPLRQLVTTAGRISRGNLRAKVEHASRDEIGYLAEAFNSMTARLRRRLQVENLVVSMTRNFLVLPAGQASRAIQEALEEIVIFTGTDACYLLDIGLDSPFLTVRGHAGDKQTGWAFSPKASRMESLPWLLKCLRRGECLKVEDVENLPAEAEQEKTLWREFEVGSILCEVVPSVGHGVRLLLVETHGRTMRWDKEMRRLLLLVGETLSTILERERMEAALSREARINVIFADLSRFLITRTDYEGISRLVMESAQELTNSPAAFAGYMDAKTGRMLVPGQADMLWSEKSDQGDDPLELDVSNGLCAQALEKRAPVMMNHPVAAPVSSGPYAAPDPLNTFMAAPALAGDELCGIVAVANAEAYSERDPLSLERLAALYAMAIKRRRGEDALTENEYRYRMLFNNTNDAIFVNRATADAWFGEFIDVNDVACERLGLARKELLEKDPKQLGLSDLGPEQERIGNDLARFGHAVFETSQTGPDGREIPVEVDSHIFELMGEPTILTMARDITDRKQVERNLADMNKRLEEQVRVRTEDLARKAQELEQANERLMELDKLKSSFLTSVSHELRTPLTSILGFAKLVNKDFSKYYRKMGDGESRLEKRGDRILVNLGIIEHEGARLTRMINDFLDLSKIEAGRIEWHDREVGMTNVILRAVEALWGGFAENEEVRLDVDVPDDLPVMKVDSDRMEEVFINLLSNALKFTHKGTVTISAREITGGILQVRIADTGKGIAADDLESIFNKFHQASRQDDREAKPQGTGLGLAICRGVVTHYKGRIWAESEVGQGSTFYVELPLSREPEEACAPVYFDAS